MSEKYFWPSYGEDIKRYIESCDACQRRGKPQRNEPLHPIKVGQPFSRVDIDIIGPLNISKLKNQYIVTATDYLTKWVEARALKKANAANVAKFLWEDIICRYGSPKELLSDRGWVFLSETIKEICKAME